LRPANCVTEFLKEFPEGILGRWNDLLNYPSGVTVKVGYSVSGGSSLASVVAGSKPTRSWDKPQFDDIAPRNVTAIAGQMAELNCYVKHPGDRVVSNIFMLHLPRIHCFFPRCGRMKVQEYSRLGVSLFSPRFFSSLTLAARCLSLKSGRIIAAIFQRR
jgi:hypothetical protein